MLRLTSNRHACLHARISYKLAQNWPTPAFEATHYA